jgi:hypothetical protein
MIGTRWTGYMTIYLLCECGKKLKARQEHAGRRVMCTRCQQIWRLGGLGGGSKGATLALEPLAASDPADDSSLVTLGTDDDLETGGRIVVYWLLGFLMLAAFVAGVYFLLRWLEGPGGTPEPPVATDAIPPALRKAQEKQVPIAPPEETVPEKPEPEPPGEAKHKPAATPPTTPEAQPEPRPPAAPVIDRVEPAEALPGQSITVIVRDKAPEGGKQEFRIGSDGPWQPVVDQRIKLTARKEGPLNLQVRAVDAKGVPSPIQQRPIPIKPAPPFLSRLKVGDVLWQEVTVGRVSSYRLLGQDVAQNTQYSFLSRFKVEKHNDDGSLVLEQRVEHARVDKMDPLLKELLGDVVEKTKGLTFRITLSPTHEIVKFEGTPQPPQVLGGGNPLQAQMFLVWSILDQDGWKELNQLSFFLPERELQPGVKWKRAMTHNWGPLGHWKGDVNHAAGPKQQNRQRIDYSLDLRYHAPTAGASTTNLPFKIAKAEFKPPVASGTLIFDLGHHLVASAEERFHVRGQLHAVILGSELAVELDEQQHFQVRLHQQKPRGW